ncbi:HEAT repeat domain-containing protein [Kitasatospora sp. NBC_00240]|uniref:HEAT repeat domain-containing protein n=1 Tax=Kitasatospora sp. NBC_00240 TaxID=2903567 RepID=UPI0022527F7F|nr:HEAT repeat domain-containing protein [Kitasatospora sp. NBC_00240]MCX5213866.1 HEAT repeat domain-containing protein [Kitasatospora sp. NBC_00240]
MDTESDSALIEQAARRAGPGARTALRALLSDVAEDGAWAVRLGPGLLDSADPLVRRAGCDLLAEAADRHEPVREAVTAAVLALAAEDEPDHQVQRAAVRALGAGQDARAVPVLLALAAHPDPEVRRAVAEALPPVSTDDPGRVLPALIRLTGDADPEVRNWATFALGFQVEADSPEVRAALWNRTADEYAAAREEGIRGLARRRDPRAVPLLAELLDDEAGAHVLTFRAAAILGAAELLPHLEHYDPADPGVADALAGCDPAVRARDEAFAAALLDTLHRQAPDSDAAVHAERFETGLTLTLTAAGEILHWSVEGLLDRSAGAPDRAAASVLASLAGGRA